MTNISPGWYKDPAEPTTQRYWDGDGWVGGPLPADATPPEGPIEAPPTAATDDPAPEPAGDGAGSGVPPERAGTTGGPLPPSAPQWPAPGAFPPPPPGYPPPPAYRLPPGYPPLPPGAQPPPGLPAAAAARAPTPGFRLRDIRSCPRVRRCPTGRPACRSRVLLTCCARSRVRTASRWPRSGCRFLARLIDIVAVLLLNVVLNGWLVYQWFQETRGFWSAAMHATNGADLPGMSSRGGLLQTVIILLAIAIWLVYEVPFIANGGQTLGKRIMGIRVVPLEGMRPARATAAPCAAGLRSACRWCSG